MSNVRIIEDGKEKIEEAGTKVKLEQKINSAELRKLLNEKENKSK